MLFIVVLALLVLLCVGPVMVGARMVGAGYSGFWRCFGAVIVASIIGAIAVKLFRGLAILSIFGSALGYMIVLDTSYLKGLGIALIQDVLVVVIVLALFVTGLSAGLGMKPFFHGSTARTTSSAV